ncbi:Dual specificity protein kinase clk3 [Mortierella sp. NVP85]|nr:Dual specificity protein kinase clk3 [Mortierella sp. NVP85]
MTATSQARSEKQSTDWTDFYKNGPPQEVIVIEDDTPPPSSSSASLKSSHHRRLAPGSGSNGRHYHNRSSHHHPYQLEPLSRSHAMPPPPLTLAYGAANGGNSNGYHSGPSTNMVQESASGRGSRRSNKRLPSTDLILVGPGVSYSYSSYPYQYQPSLYLPVPAIPDPHYYNYSGSTHHYPSNSHSHHYGGYYHHADFAYSDADCGYLSGSGAAMAPSSRKRRKSNSDIKYFGPPPPPGSHHGYPVYYHHPPIHGPNAPYIVPGAVRETLPIIPPWDDKEGHYIVVPGDDLTSRYKIIRLLGQGTFGKVVECYDRETGKYCAIKIIRAVQKYRDASKIEARVLRTLKQHDPRNAKNHVCMVFDLLGQSIYDWLKDNAFCPFPPNQIQYFARQLFNSVAFLHRLQLIHTDLKPENILLTNGNYRQVPYKKSPNKMRRVLVDPEIRLIDFGSATFQEEHHSTVVCTRHYRAPEIILEFLTGEALFQTHDNLEHLAMMEAVLGPIPEKLTRASHKSAQKYFVQGRLDYPNDETKRNSRKYVKALRPLQDYVIPPDCTGESLEFAHAFLDLLKGLLAYDPAVRITAADALRHPYFNYVVNEDGQVTGIKKHSSSSSTVVAPASFTPSAQSRGV